MAHFRWKGMYKFLRASLAGHYTTVNRLCVVVQEPEFLLGPWSWTLGNNCLYTYANTTYDIKAEMFCCALWCIFAGAFRPAVCSSSDDQRHRGTQQSELIDNAMETAMR
jgi:hypothetical protein